MNEELIRELGNYAALKISQSVVPVITITVIVLLVITVVGIRVWREMNEEIVDSKPESKKRFICSASLVIMIILSVYAGMISNYISDIIGWSTYPEAMLIDSTFEKS